MHRRSLIAAALAGAGGLFAVAAHTAPAKATETNRTIPDMAKVVYHLADLDKVSFVLGNIANHYDGMGGPERVTIALVVHGPALKAFLASAANPDMTRRVSGFSNSGLALHACGNTMKAQNITLKDLLPGFVEADRGGVVRIAELQASGYVYLRP